MFVDGSGSPGLLQSCERRPRSRLVVDLTKALAVSSSPPISALNAFLQMVNGSASLMYDSERGPTKKYEALQLLVSARLVSSPTL